MELVILVYIPKKNNQNLTKDNLNMKWKKIETLELVQVLLFMIYLFMIK